MTRNVFEDAVFIGGSGRSGTSFMLNLIVRHPDFVAFGNLETKFLIESGGLLDLYRALVTDYNASRSQFALRRFSDFMLKRVSGENASPDTRLTEHVPPDIFHDIVTEFIADLSVGSTPRFLSQKEFVLLAQTFFEKLITALADGDVSKRYVEKTPHNILHVWFLQILFPNVKLIHMVRDPRAVVYSLKRQSWAPDTVEDCCYWLREVYRAFNARTLATQDEDADTMLLVRLEDFVTELDEVNARISEHCQIPNFAILPDEVDQAAITSWKSTITTDDRDLINRILGQFIEQFGYDLDDN